MTSLLCRIIFIFEEVLSLVVRRRIVIKLRFCEPLRLAHVQHPIESWLRQHPAVADAIVWRAPAPGKPNGAPIPYRAWSSLQRAQLHDTVDRIRTTGDAGLPDAPQSQVTVETDGSLFATTFDHDTAWSIYLAHVAQSLVVERSGGSSWSVTSYRPDELAVLFDSASLFELTALGYAVLRFHNVLTSHGAATPSDPARTFRFLRSNGLVGSTPRDTVARLLDWCRDNLTHYNSYPRRLGDPIDLNAYWHYHGWPPVARVIAGTTHLTQGDHHWTMGCWGTTGFLALVLRTVNIPVTLVHCDRAHAMPSFVTLGAYLSHGDDPYSQFSRFEPRFPIEDLFIDQATFDTSFPATGGIRTCRNSGRRPMDLVVRNLPNDLLRVYCDDMRNGSSHAGGQVFLAYFNGAISVAELESLGLWSRMDAKIAAFGGCTSIP